MTSITIAFLIGWFIGALVGFFIAVQCHVWKQADGHIERQRGYPGDGS